VEEPAAGITPGFSGSLKMICSKYLFRKIKKGICQAVNIKKVNLKKKFNKFSKYWDPKIVGALNGQHVKLVKFKGPFVWHRHEAEDEMFLVVLGSFTLHLRKKSIELNEGEFIIVPQGIEHRPEAEKEVHVLLFEPAATINTGNVTGAKTVKNPEWI
jgi:mannose-6-phosphate isomerase-like protein (cupin superfamily)